jgi:hypothetical protein
MKLNSLLLKNGNKEIMTRVRRTRTKMELRVMSRVMLSMNRM